MKEFDRCAWAIGDYSNWSRSVLPACQSRDEPASQTRLPQTGTAQTQVAIRPSVERGRSDVEESPKNWSLGHVFGTSNGRPVHVLDLALRKDDFLIVLLIQGYDLPVHRPAAYLELFMHKRIFPLNGPATRCS